MESKVYAQFEVDDPCYKAHNLFSSVVMVPGDTTVSELHLQLLLAESFDIDFDRVQLVSWCRLH
ncbi:MAG: hypothetical protein AAF270_05340 [Pseudomonadota bacterium]